jgi:hypothetical protein
MEPNLESVLANVYGDTLRKIAEDLIGQVAGYEESIRLSREERKHMTELIASAKAVTGYYVDYLSIGYRHLQSDMVLFIEKHMPELARDQKLDEIGIR